MLAGNVGTVYFRAPRVCGDDPNKVPSANRVCVVLPAYAGMIPVTRLAVSPLRLVPCRIRG